MALTKIRGAQIQDGAIGNNHINPASPIHYSNLALSSSIVAGDLNQSNHSVHIDVLEYKLIALWDQAVEQSVSGASADVTSVVTSARHTAATTSDATTKGVLTSGTGASGAGIQNYRVQIRDWATKEPVNDEIDGSVYGELTFESNAYTLNFKKSDGQPFSMGAGEVTTVGVTADVAGSLGGRYFTFATPSAKYYAWFNTGSSADPAPAGYTGVPVSISAGASASNVATALRTAVNDIGGGPVSAAGSGSTVTLTNAATGNVEEADDGVAPKETRFTIATTTEGTPGKVDFLFVEIYDLLDAPVKSFIQGTGFTDVMGVTGTHNHNELYYTKVDLESGQLDDRYFTETELLGGSIDSKYYNKTNLSPSAAQGDNVLDPRYFTETEIGSTTPGFSGAGLVGVSAVTNLAGGTVQAALAELQGDVDNIISGTTLLDLSLDDAYDKGSAIAVDNTDVAWTLSSSKKFVIADSADAAKFQVTQGSAANSVKIATTGGVDVDATAGVNIAAGTASFALTSAGAGSITTSTGQDLALTGAAGATVEAGTGILTLQNTTSSAAGSVLITSASGGIGVQSAATKAIALQAGGALTLKDTHLTAAVALSQTSVAALSTNLNTATSIVGAINENTDDLYTLINTTLPAATSGSSGAKGVGVTGITGVTPTGGSLEGNGNVQSMLEGIALAAGGGKTFANIAAFTTAKGAGTYFKLNEPVFILDINRWAIVKTQAVDVVEGTDWDYVGGAARNIAGAAYKFNLTGTAADSFKVATAGGMEVSVASGKPINLDAASGGFVHMTTTGHFVAGSSAGNANISANAYMTLSAETGKIDIKDFQSTDADAIKIEALLGGVEISGATNKNIALHTDGTGVIAATAADTVQLNGGAIDINAGLGKNITVDTNSKVLITSTGATADAIKLDAESGGVQLVGGALALDAGMASHFHVLDAGLTLSTTVSGNVNLTAAGDIVGTSVKASFAPSSTAADAFKVDTVGGISLLTDGGLSANDDSGSSITMLGTGEIDLSSGGGQKIELSARANLVLSSDASTQIISGSAAETSVDIAPTAGGITATSAVDKSFTVNTSGTGVVDINSSLKINLDAPRVDIAGDTYVAADKKLYVDQINITSVDPSDTATISGRRGGVVNALNKLTNSGFEQGVAIAATGWVQDAAATRVQTQKYYGSYSLKLNGTLSSETTAAKHAASGLTNSGDYTVSFYALGTNVGKISAKLAGGTAVEVVAAGANPTAWTRYDVDVVSGGTSGDLEIIADVGAIAMHIDAVMLESGTTLHDYFTGGYASDLLVTVGNEVDDKIVFRTFDGTADYTDLMAINQDTVRIYGDLLVDGQMTTINSNNVNIGDNMQTWNADITEPAQNSDAFLQIKRLVAGATGAIQGMSLTGGGGADHIITLASGEGTAWAANKYLEVYGATNADNNGLYMVSAVTGDVLTLNKVYNTLTAAQAGVAGNIREAAPAIIRWNETVDKIQLLNMASGSFENIATTVGSGAISMQSAYDGGSSVTANVGDVAFTLNASKKFEIVDGTDASKFVVSAGTDASSIKMDTSGGISANADGTIVFAQDTDIDNYLKVAAALTEVKNTSAINVVAGSGQLQVAAVSGKMVLAATNSTASDAISMTSAAGGIDINAAATKPITMDSGSFSIDGVQVSNVTVTSAALTVSTATSGDLNVSAAGILNMDGNSVTIDAVSGQNVAITTAGAGKTLVTGELEVAGLLDLNGSFDQSGNYTFLVNTTATAADSVKVTTAGGVDVNAAGAIALDSGAPSNFTVDSGNLTLSTTTSGDVAANAAGALDFDSMNGAAINDDSGAYLTISSLGEIHLRAASGQFIAIEGDAGSNYLQADTETIALHSASTGDNSILLDTTGGIDINAAATKPITMDSGSFSIDGVQASNVTVTGAHLTLSTATSGDVKIASAGAITFDDANIGTAIPMSDSSHYTLPGSATSIIGAINAAYDYAVAHDTLDEIYDAESGTRTVTVDNGSVKWNMGNGYSTVFADAAGTTIVAVNSVTAANTMTVNADIAQNAATASFTLSGTGADSLKINTQGGVDIDTKAGVAINDDSGANVLISAAGAITVATAANQALSASGDAVTLTASGTTGTMELSSSGLLTMHGQGVSVYSAASYDVTISSTSTGATKIESAATIQLNGGAVDVNCGSNKDFTLDTAGTGKVDIFSATAVEIDAAANSYVKVTGANLTIGTATSGELYFDDARTNAIAFSDAANTTLPGTATSVLGAIKAAYDNMGTEITKSYAEIIATGTDVTNDYIVTTLDLPTSGSFPMIPGALRTGAGTNQWHLVVYLNGLRLADTEWRYSYAGSQCRIAFDGSDNITLVSDDKLMLDLTKINDQMA